MAKKTFHKEEFDNDIEAYKFALKNRCLVKHASDILKKLMKQGKIQKFKNSKQEITIFIE
jgi:hypothetical protein